MKEIWISVLAVWIALLFLFIRRRMGRNPAQGSRAIAFVPTEPVTPRELAGYLLSANLAVLEHDNFNQLGSALPAWRVRALLLRYWDVTSLQSFHEALEHRLQWYGIGSEEEMQALEAWREGEAEPSDAYAALEDICQFLSVHAGLASPRDIGPHHANLMAWDVQQLAYLVRLGFTLQYLSRDRAQGILKMLQGEIRLHYRSWKEYSLSSLIGMGLRSPIDLEDVGDWYHIARSHAMLLHAASSPIAHARLWGPSLLQTRPPKDLGAPPSTFSDTLV
jgi:hypothetical protein